MPDWDRRFPEIRATIQNADHLRVLWLFLGDGGVTAKIAAIARRFVRVVAEKVSLRDPITLPSTKQTCRSGYLN